MSLPQPRPHSTGAKPAPDALITAPSAPLVELRQNNPQDCANLIAASVDRATVEISRTIIRLNATFSQQLQQASISASNGIKSAENSASSSISIVSQNASSATSSASFSLNLANLAVTSVNSALTNANIALASAQSQVAGVNLILTSALSASTSDVLRLSSSLSSLEASLVSVKASASNAVAVAVMSQQSLKDPQVTAAISLVPIQLAGIVVGIMLASVFLSFTVGFVLMRARNKEKSNSFNDKEPLRDPKIALPRDSMAFRPGNSVVIKFSPPMSLRNISPASERHGSLSATRSAPEKEQLPIATVWDTEGPSNNSFTSRTNEWPLAAGFDDNLNGTSKEVWPQTTITPRMSAQNAESTPDSSSAIGLHFDMSQNITSTSEVASMPAKAGNGGAIDTPGTAGQNSDPAAQPPLGFESLHRIAGDFGPEVTEALQETDLDEDSWPIREPAQESSYGLAANNKSEKFVPAAEALADPCKDPSMEPHESLIVGLLGVPVEQSFGQPLEAPSNTMADGYLEEPVGQEEKILWKRPHETLLGDDAKGFLTREVEELLLEPDTSSAVVVAHTQNPEAPNLPEQNETASERSSVQHVRTTSPEQTQDRVPKKWSSSELQATAIQALHGSADGTISPLHRNPTVGFPEKVEPRSSDSVNKEREISPLRRNPPFEAFEGIISLLDEQQGGAIKIKEEEVDEYESRGRSMIRTSDIIEARLSGLAQVNHEGVSEQRGRKDKPDDLLPASSAHLQQVTTTEPAHRSQNSPKRKAVVAKQLISTKGSPPLISNSLSRPVSATSAAVTPRREESSPLRRNPPDIISPSRRARDTGAATSTSTKEFSRALSKFQTLVSQNPQDAVVASNEVTSRAIAGIYIPGSLREQAVRNLSKSRERATGERQRK